MVSETHMSIGYWMSPLGWCTHSTTLLFSRSAPMPVLSYWYHTQLGAQANSGLILDSISISCDSVNECFWIYMLPFSPLTTAPSLALISYLFFCSYLLMDLGAFRMVSDNKYGYIIPWLKLLVASHSVWSTFQVLSWNILVPYSIGHI